VQWSAAGFLEDVVLARPGNGTVGIHTTVVKAGNAEDVRFVDLLDQMTEPPLLLRVSMLSGEDGDDQVARARNGPTRST